MIGLTRRIEFRGLRKFLILLPISCVFARSPIRYETIFVLVVVELFFAFAVGIACILFSLNMFRALNRSPEVYRSLPIGDFPRPLPTCSTVSGGNQNEQLDIVNLVPSDGVIDHSLCFSLLLFIQCFPI